jgi:pectin methylesterase-like acyl-CoA thioesterase
MNIFRLFFARCAECHTPPLFTNQQVAVIKVMPGTYKESVYIDKDNITLSDVIEQGILLSSTISLSIRACMAFFHS